MTKQMPTGTQFLVQRNAQDLAAIFDLLEEVKSLQTVVAALTKELESHKKAPKK